jgi:hypothetical protein
LDATIRSALPLLFGMQIEQFLKGDFQPLALRIGQRWLGGKPVSEDFGWLGQQVGNVVF